MLSSQQSNGYFNQSNNMFFGATVSDPISGNNNRKRQHDHVSLDNDSSCVQQAKRQALNGKWSPSTDATQPSTKETSIGTSKTPKESEEKQDDAMLDPTALVFSPRVLKPAPYFYYTDHSLEIDDDPLIPVTMSGRVPTFPAKMHAILANKDLNDIVAWADHGRSWCILNPRQFEIHILPKYFEHSKFSSFVRQCNGWGFRRMSHGQDRNAYFHEYFLRGMPWLCKKMRRPKVSEKKALDPEHEPDLAAISREFPVVDRPPASELLVVQQVMELGPRARMPVQWVTGNSNFSDPLFGMSSQMPFSTDEQFKSLNPTAQGLNNSNFGETFCGNSNGVQFREVNSQPNGFQKFNDSFAACNGGMKPFANYYVPTPKESEDSPSKTISQGHLTDAYKSYYSVQNEGQGALQDSGITSRRGTFSDIEPIPLLNDQNPVASNLFKASRNGSLRISFSNGCWEPEPVDVSSNFKNIGTAEGVADGSNSSQQGSNYWDPETYGASNKFLYGSQVPSANESNNNGRISDSMGSTYESSQFSAGFIAATEFHTKQLQNWLDHSFQSNGYCLPNNVDTNSNNRSNSIDVLGSV